MANRNRKWKYLFCFPIRTGRYREEELEAKFKVLENKFSELEKKHEELANSIRGDLEKKHDELANEVRTDRSKNSVLHLYIFFVVWCLW